MYSELFTNNLKDILNCSVCFDRNNFSSMALAISIKDQRMILVDYLHVYIYAFRFFLETKTSCQ